MFTVRGIAATKAALVKVGVQIEAASPTAVNESGKAVVSQMNARAPRDTGFLASVIGVETDSAGSGATARVGSDAPYDKFVQRGTKYMRAQPYGQDAAVAAAPEVVARMAAVYKAAVEG